MNAKALADFRVGHGAALGGHRPSRSPPARFFESWRAVDDGEFRRLEILAARHEDSVVLGVYLPTVNNAVDVDRRLFH